MKIKHAAKQKQCKSKEELKTYVKLKMRGGKLQLETGISNNIKGIDVGQYCECQSLLLLQV